LEETPAYLKQKADDCRKQADEAATEDERARWLKMASLFHGQAEILSASANDLD
jgi:hypothetical protein